MHATLRIQSTVAPWPGPLAVIVWLLALSPSPATGQSSTAGDYEALCDEGDLVACSVLGLLYERGTGVERDPARAVELHARACRGGEPSGCANLGRLHEAGTGVDADPERALELFRLACRGGDRWSCDRLTEAGAPAPDAEVGIHFKSGRVGDAETGLALADVLVEVPELGLRTTTDATGRFALTGLPEGRHRIRVERFGYESVEGGIDVPGEDLVLLLLVRSVAEDPDETGTVVGRVTDTEGNSLSDVEISVEGHPQARVLTDGRGRFTLPDVPPGLARMRFVRLGYAGRNAELVVRPGRTSEVEATLATEPIELEPIEVTVRSSYLERTGFYRRARRGGRGAQFDRADIEELKPNVTSDLLRRVPGVRAVYEGGQTLAEGRYRYARGRCRLAVRVDGQPTFDRDLDWIPPEWIEAVEVYQGMTMPIEYTSRFGECGVVLIWTRRGG